MRLGGEFRQARDDGFGRAVDLVPILSRGRRLTRGMRFPYGIFIWAGLCSGQVTARRTIRRTSIKVQLRINHMDVCCGPPGIFHPILH